MHNKSDQPSIVFDPAKDLSNIQKHNGISLHEANAFEWDSALVWTDKRKNYEEERQIALGYIGLRLFVLVFVHREHECRVISLRKANAREINHYEQTQNSFTHSRR